MVIIGRRDFLPVAKNSRIGNLSVCVDHVRINTSLKRKGHVPVEETSTVFFQNALKSGPPVPGP